MPADGLAYSALLKNELLGAGIEKVQDPQTEDRRLQPSTPEKKGLFTVSLPAVPPLAAGPCGDSLLLSWTLAETKVTAGQVLCDRRAARCWGQGRQPQQTHRECPSSWGPGSVRKSLAWVTLAVAAGKVPGRGPVCRSRVPGAWDAPRQTPSWGGPHFADQPHSTQVSRAVGRGPLSRCAPPTPVFPQHQALEPRRRQRRVSLLLVPRQQQKVSLGLRGGMGSWAVHGATSGPLHCTESRGSPRDTPPTGDTWPRDIDLQGGVAESGKALRRRCRCGS